MLALLATALLVAVVLTVPAVLVVLTARARRHRSPLLATTTAAAVAGVLVATAALAVGAVVGAGVVRSLVVAIVLGGSLLAWAPATRDLDVRMLAAWALAVDVGILYLAYAATWTLQAGLGLRAALVSLGLWLLEAFVLLVALGRLWDRLNGPRGHRRQVRGGVFITASALVGVACFAALASLVGGPRVGDLPHRLVQEARASQSPESPDVPATRTTSSHSAASGTPTTGQVGATSGASTSGSVVVRTSATRSGPSSVHASSTTPSRTPSAQPSSQPTLTPSSSPPSTKPTGSTGPTQSTSPTESQPTHPTHPPHPTHPTRSPSQGLTVSGIVSGIAPLWERLLGVG